MDNKKIDIKWCRRRYVLLKDTQIVRYSVIDTFEKRYQNMRAKISEFARIMDMLSKEIVGSRLIMITLTIAKIEDYNAGMIRDYIKNLKQRLGKNLFGFAWVAEIQRRGAVHYHLEIMVPKNIRVPMPDKSGMWPWGSSKTEKARTAYYLCTYIGKESQKDLSRYPKSCRTFAVSYRLPEGQTKAYLQALKESDKLRKEAYQVMKDFEKKSWEYVGACVNKDYATDVLVPSYDKEKIC